MPSVHLTENISYYFAEEDLRPGDNPYVILRQRMERAKMTRADLADANTPKSQRPMAGSKRAEKHQHRAQQEHTGSVSGQMLQSITAAPALNHSSFEELRLECYLQSATAKGGPPSPVDAVESSWAIIPPVFHAFKDEEDEDADLFLSEIVMED